MNNEIISLIKEKNYYIKESDNFELLNADSISNCEHNLNCLRKKCIYLEKATVIALTIYQKLKENGILIWNYNQLVKSIENEDYLLCIKYTNKITELENINI